MASTVYQVTTSLFIIIIIIIILLFVSFSYQHKLMSFHESLSDC